MEAKNGQKRQGVPVTLAVLEPPLLFRLILYKQHVLTYHVLFLVQILHDLCPRLCCRHGDSCGCPFCPSRLAHHRLCRHFANGDGGSEPLPAAHRAKPSTDDILMVILIQSSLNIAWDTSAMNGPFFNSTLSEGSRPPLPYESSFSCDGGDIYDASQLLSSE